MILHRIQTNKWCHIRKCYPLTLRPTFITSLLKLNMPSMKPTTVIITFEVFSDHHMLLPTALATMKSKIYINKKPVVTASFSIKMEVHPWNCSLKSLKLGLEETCFVDHNSTLSTLSVICCWYIQLRNCEELEYFSRILFCCFLQHCDIHFNMKRYS